MAVLVGLVLFFVSYVADWALSLVGISFVASIVNNIVIGACGGAVAYMWARFEAERQARAREKMILLVELNHHIRNALVILGQSAALQDGPEKLRLIDEAVDRVDRVLTELVPTVGETSAPRLFLDDVQRPSGPFPPKR